MLPPVPPWRWVRLSWLPAALWQQQASSAPAQPWRSWLFSLLPALLWPRRVSWRRRLRLQQRLPWRCASLCSWPAAMAASAPLPPAEAVLALPLAVAACSAWMPSPDAAGLRRDGLAPSVTGAPSADAPAGAFLSGRRRSRATGLSPGSSSIRRTPRLVRPAAGISSNGRRTTWPWAEIISTSSPGVMQRAAASEPVFSLTGRRHDAAAATSLRRVVASAACACPSPGW